MVDFAHAGRRSSARYVLGATILRLTTDTLLRARFCGFTRVQILGDLCTQVAEPRGVDEWCDSGPAHRRVLPRSVTLVTRAPACSSHR